MGTWSYKNSNGGFLGTKSKRVLLTTGTAFHELLLGSKGDINKGSSRYCKHFERVGNQEEMQFWGK